MTNKEAIAILTAMQEPEPWENPITQAAFDALQMAIEALKTVRVDACTDCQEFDCHECEYFKERRTDG